MRKKLIAAALILIPFSQGPVLARTLTEVAVHVCGCDGRLCRCLHHHQRPAKPKCHGDEGKPLPNLQSCQSREEQALSSAPFLLPTRLPLAQPAAQKELAATPHLHLSTFSPQVIPPPPRTALR